MRDCKGLAASPCTLGVVVTLNSPVSSLSFFLLLLLFLLPPCVFFVDLDAAVVIIN